MALAPGARVGRYEVLGLLGIGGMGEVYRARDLGLNRLVAIKALPADLEHNPERRARLDREARAVAALTHPHICVVHDVLHEEGRPLIVMEYVEGETLAARIARGPLDARDTLKCGMQLAGALEAAHRRGILHRDLKPSNIMLTVHGVKLLDFGIAKVGHDTLDGSAPTTLSTRSGAVLGTLPYLSPEQAFGRDLDARSDPARRRVL